jgi:3-methyladenine DNA glycosylase Tag
VTQPETPTPTPPAPEAPSQAPEAPPAGDKGFPDGTPLEQMTPEQQAAYWKHYARKHEDTVKAFKGLTPQQVAEMQAKNEELEAKALTADEKALKAVRDEATKQARAQAEAEFLPQIRAAKVQAIASTIVSGDKLTAFMDIVDPVKLLGEDGAVDETKVMGYLTAMYGGEPQQQSGPRWQNFGQYTPPPPPQKPGAGGSAEAAKRFGTKT